MSILTLLSCDHDDEVVKEFEVTVAGEGIDCKLILIDFQEKDLKAIEKITSIKDWRRYQAFNLDKNLGQVGQVLMVKVRKTKDDELFACTTLGPGYPWLTVLNARLEE